MEINLKNLLQKCADKTSRVLLQEGLYNNCNLSQEERSALLKLAEEMNLSDFVIMFDDIAVTVYKTSFDQGYILTGLEFKKVERW